MNCVSLSGLWLALTRYVCATNNVEFYGRCVSCDTHKCVALTRCFLREKEWIYMITKMWLKTMTDI